MDTRPIWAISLTPNPTTAESRMKMLYRKFTGTSATWNFPPTVTKRIVLACKGRAVNLAKAVVLGKVPEIPRANVVGEIAALQSLADVSRMLTTAKAYLDTSKVDWARRYQKLSTVYGMGSGKEDLEKSILFGAASKLMASLTPDLLLNTSTGFIEAMKPESSYIWDMAKAYVRKRKIASKLPCIKPPATARDIAEALDTALSPKVSFATAVDFASDRAGMLARDFMEGITKPEMPDDEEPELTVVAEPEYTATDAETAMKLAELSMLMESDTGYAIKLSYQAVANSYPDIDTFDEYAKANGYRDSVAAYEEEGELAVYDLENAFCTTAVNKLSKALVETRKEEEIAGTMF